MNGPAVGTAFHPLAESGFNGKARSAGRSPQLARLPRRRRPGMLALAVALVGAGILASTAVYSATNHRVPVLVATADVPAGALISAADIGTASIAAGPGVQVIPASQLRQVVGQVAGSALHPGMLLTAAELAATRPPGPGQVLVALPLKPSVLPASGLAPGDHVLIVATPGAQGQSASSAAAPVLTAPVTGVVEAVTPSANTDGYQVVDVIVAAGKGPAVVQQASTGQFALVVVRRAP
ncbi:MAG TPA: SAF domain-containing protein [Streptosporangiaceae bacterium]